MWPFLKILPFLEDVRVDSRILALTISLFVMSLRSIRDSLNWFLLLCSLNVLDEIAHPPIYVYTLVVSSLELQECKGGMFDVRLSEASHNVSKPLSVENWRPLEDFKFGHCTSLFWRWRQTNLSKLKTQVRGAHAEIILPIKYAHSWRPHTTIGSREL